MNIENAKIKLTAKARTLLENGAVFVKVYWNVTRRMWSVSEARTPVRHVFTFWLSDAVFHVGPAGRERVRQTGVKNVHAWVRGTEAVDGGPIYARHRRIRYNPYENESFVYADTGLPCHRAAWAYFTSDGKVYVEG